MEQVVQGGMLIHGGLLMVVQLLSPLILLMQSLQVTWKYKDFELTNWCPNKSSSEIVKIFWWALNKIPRMSLKNCDWWWNVALSLQPWQKTSYLSRIILIHYGQEVAFSEVCCKTDCIKFYYITNLQHLQHCAHVPGYYFAIFSC